MTYLVTGGAGFIGSHLVETLLQRGETVRVLDNFSTGRRENLKEIIDRYSLVEGRDYIWLRSVSGLPGPSHRLTVIEGDVRDQETCRKAVQGVVFILHQAAIASVPKSIADPVTTQEVNVTGTLNLLLASREAHVKRFVLASSSAVYGDDPTLPKHEMMTPGPLSPYAASKQMSEYYCQIASQLWEVPTVCLRYFNIYGPRQDPNSQYSGVVARFISDLADGRYPTIFGDGEQSRDFTFIEDCIQANLLACRALDLGKRVFNIGCGQGISVNRLYQELAQIFNQPVSPRYSGPRMGDIRHSVADISLAKVFLDYQPKISLAEGLRRTVAYYRAPVNA